MQKFKRKSLYLALVAAVGSVGITNTASAGVHVDGNGLGEVLIYPYYSTRAGMDTYLSVVNTTASSKAVKVRFTEGKNSREVLDFNLYLSPHDMWTAAVINTTSGAKVITADKSCTSPALPATGQDFVNSAFSGAPKQGIQEFGGDGETASLDRTREGYFEIIEMGVITNASINTAVTHVNGVPANCAVVQADSMNMAPSGGANAVVKPTGGLAGTASLINVAGGTDFGYDPVVLAAFAPANIWDFPGSIEPDLKSGVSDSTVFYNESVVTSRWNDPVDAVSSVLMHNNIINEYVLDSVTASGTDWVITMPTKRYYVPVDNPDVTPDFIASAPFTKTFWLEGACEPVGIQFWNREEQSQTAKFSPPSAGGGASLCWETNVVTFNDSNILGSANSENVSIPSFQNGWMRMSFDDAGHRLVDDFGDTYFGLPTVGFMVQDFINGNVNGLLSNYGGNFVHKYNTQITDSNNGF